MKVLPHPRSRAHERLSQEVLAPGDRTILKFLVVIDRLNGRLNVWFGHKHSVRTSDQNLAFARVVQYSRRTWALSDLAVDNRSDRLPSAPSNLIASATPNLRLESIVLKLAGKVFGHVLGEGRREDPFGEFLRCADILREIMFQSW